MEERRDAATLTFAARLIDASPDAMLALSLDGRVLFWSRGAQTLFGHAPSQALGARWEELSVPLDQRQELRHVLASTDAGGQSFEAQLLGRDGTPVRVHVTLRRVEGAGTDAFVAVSARSADLPQRARCATPCTANPARISHDLRTPLNAVIGFAELMRTGRLGPVSAEHQEYLGDILTSCGDLLALIHHLFDTPPVEPARAASLAAELSGDPSQLPGGGRP